MTILFELQWLQWRRQQQQQNIKKTSINLNRFMLKKLFNQKLISNLKFGNPKKKNICLQKKKQQ